MHSECLLSHRFSQTDNGELCDGCYNLRKSSLNPLQTVDSYCFTNCLYLLNYPRMYQNIKGHGTKQSKFYDSLHYTAFNVVFFTVAWLNALYQHQSLFLRRYTVLRPDRNWSDTTCERPMALVSGGIIFSSVRSLLLFVGVFTLNDHSFLPVSGQFSGAANIFLFFFFFFCWYYIPAWDLITFYL